MPYAAVCIWYLICEVDTLVPAVVKVLVKALVQASIILLCGANVPNNIENNKEHVIRLRIQLLLRIRNTTINSILCHCQQSY